MIPWCEAHGAAVVAYSPLGHGHFPARTRGGRVLREIAKRTARPAPGCVAVPGAAPSLFAIPKASSPAHATENAGAGDLRLTDAEFARIDAAFPRGPRPRGLPML